MKSKKVDYMLLGLGITSFILNAVFKNSEDSLEIILRNIPMIVLASMTIFKLRIQAISKPDQPFKLLWLVLLLALVFTVGFEVLHTTIPFFIILMMPKTLMYIWLVLMGYNAYRKTKLN